MNSLFSEQVLPVTIAEKLQLIEDIWNSVVIEADQIPLNQSQEQELDPRLASYQNIQNRGESWEIVRQRIIKHDI
ncbi:MAG TPA: addiction module protein [Cyanobacteria bacterium UBA11149]|nr:addiction module protein [Cyanobacteria bacterium UBA11367]HBE56837.1 addiction module protein [Cyanobacteria bacterium UBA11366]HBK63292.1 addiction module protein [Cyanobacteria bacterium UBA11166]HBR72169.1 addiction module protein [Cyanobacteria bacterium UBA11159]HBS71011.1 addiction module protein [Cyanobacteria bacterium UBA11153]HBW88365.1 addiction module protein [Cyanobacteria bacterium UBA11149]HCA98006.1 addiction module protein [Cyanobacteria bacterium UBA9226]